MVKDACTFLRTFALALLFLHVFVKNEKREKQVHSGDWGCGFNIVFAVFGVVGVVKGGDLGFFGDIGDFSSFFWVLVLFLRPKLRFTSVKSKFM